MGVCMSRVIQALSGEELYAEEKRTRDLLILRAEAGDDISRKIRAGPPYFIRILTPEQIEKKQPN